jgi:hypothetical protein
MIDGPWRLHVAKPGDRPLLSQFTCADKSIEWQREVEEFIQLGLADWAFDPHAVSGDPRLLLALHTRSGDLVGVAAHERVFLQDGTGQKFPATKSKLSQSPSHGRVGVSRLARGPATSLCLPS